MPVVKNYLLKEAGPIVAHLQGGKIVNVPERGEITHLPAGIIAALRESRLADQRTEYTEEEVAAQMAEYEASKAAQAEAKKATESAEPAATSEEA